MRTGQQNPALHLDCKIIAEKMQAAGIGWKIVIPESGIDIPVTQDSVLEFIWRPVMRIVFGKKSTRALDKTSGEVERIHEVIMRSLGEEHGIGWRDFPSDDARQREHHGAYRANAGQSDVPDMDETNRADKFCVARLGEQNA